MAEICFYTDELAPVTRGGLGSLLWDALHVLLAQGHAVSILADIGEEPLARFRAEYAPTLPGPLEIHGLRELVGPLFDKKEDFLSPALFRSFLVKEALVRWAERGQRFDLVEFPDIRGIAYYALVEKAAGRHFQDSLLCLRSHSALEHCTSFEAFPGYSLEHYIFYRMEQFCLRNADRVLCASPQWAQVCARRYGIPQERLLVSPPSLAARDLPKPVAREAAPDIILFHGKLQQLKGVELFVDAAVRLFSETARCENLTAVLTGADTLRSPEMGSHAQFLQKRIPSWLRDRFRFTGHVDRKALEEIFGRTLFAVTPSRTESYGYAAHELYAAGVPLIVSDIPAFEEPFVDGKNCLKFNGSVSDLYRQMKRLLEDANLRAALKSPYPIEDTPLGEAYKAYPARESQPARIDRMTVFVLSPEADAALEERTVSSLQASAGVEIAVWILRPWTEAEKIAPLWLRGKPWVAFDKNGAVASEEVRLRPALLILTSGDEVDARFPAMALETLSRSPAVGMVACWHKGEADWGSRQLRLLVERFPWELLPELAPLLRGKLLSRAVFRTPEDATLEALIDDRLGPFMEIGLAWKVLEEVRPGESASGVRREIVTLPEELVKCRAGEPGELRLSREDVGRLSLLLDTAKHKWLQPRLPRLLTTILQAAEAEAGPLTIERLGLIPQPWHITKPPPQPISTQEAAAEEKEGFVFYGKKWLVRQFLRELFRAPRPGFLKPRGRDSN